MRLSHAGIGWWVTALVDAVRRPLPSDAEPVLTLRAGVRALTPADRARLARLLEIDRYVVDADAVAPLHRRIRGQ